MKHTNVLDEAKNKGYILLTRGKDSIRTEFYNWCSSLDKPFVTAYVRTKYSNLSIDLITTSYDLQDDGQKEIFKLFRQHTAKVSAIGLSHGFCAVDYIPNEELDNLATQLLAVYETCKVKRVS